MVITKELLEKLSFENNHPERVLATFHKRAKELPEWNVTLETTYITNSNELAFNVSAWKCNDKGVIVKRVQAGFIKTTEELNKILDVCEMPWEIDESSL